MGNGGALSAARMSATGTTAGPTPVRVSAGSSLAISVSAIMTAGAVRSIAWAISSVLHQPHEHAGPGIFSGAIANWPQLGGPDLPISIVSRIPGSGTRRAFDQFVNGSSHTSKATRACITAHPRFSVTYTPKHASWLNMSSGSAS
jgi:hypothetical protein